MSTSQFNRLSAEWLREEIEDLADHLVLASGTPSKDEIRKRLLDIRSGKHWRMGCIERRKR